MGMRVQRIVKPLIFLAFLVLFSACDAMDNLLPSAGAYKIGAQVNGIPLDECSFFGFNDRVRPFFEEPVSGDPDVTSLVVFFRNSRGETMGQKVVYSLENEAEYDEILFQVRSLDGNLPSFPIPANLTTGRYTMVSQVMGGKNILQRTEKPFYFLGNSVFSFESIDIHFPGITDNTQLIARDMVVMLEAKLNFEGRMDPYIIWYNGRRRIGEGRFSDGAGTLLWKAPDQSGFYSIRAEVFPVDGHVGLTGFQREISVLVSSKPVDVNLVSGDIPQLVHWYVFEGNLNDSKINAAERALRPDTNSLQWIPVNGTYGLATGDNTVMLPKISNAIGTSVTGLESTLWRGMWQTLFRFNPVNDGTIFSVLFESSSDVSMNLIKEGQNLILTLVSPAKTVSQSIRIPEYDSFLIAGVNFSILPGRFLARINIIGDTVEQGELASAPLQLEMETEEDFLIMLGFNREDNNSADLLNRTPFFTAIWDEFALYTMPPIDVLEADVKRAGRHGLSESYISSSN